MTIQVSNITPHLQFSGKSHHYTASKVNSHFSWFASTATRTDAEPTHTCVVGAFKQSNGSVRFTLFTNDDAIVKANSVNRNTNRYKLSPQFNKLNQAKEWVNHFNKSEFEQKIPSKSIKDNDSPTASHSINIMS